MATLTQRLKRRLLRRGDPSKRHHEHRQLSEAELLARADEFNRNAEIHWQAIRGEPAGRASALNKPLNTVQEAGPVLYRLGLLLHELRLGVGHTVVDFGAGSCWLSLFLNRLGCRTIAIDVSRSALETGRELFELDPRRRRDLEARFLPYDGRTIPLADQSVDRIAVFDAFHHVPNQDDVLREMARVLRPGGRVVMAEPGENHSHADQSHAEMERFGVLENDLHFEELARKARAAGFTDVRIKPYPGPEALTFTEDQYRRFMNGRDAAYPLDVVRGTLPDLLVVALQKGEGVLDSRAPGVLRARIEPESVGEVMRGQPAEIRRTRVRLTNLGDTLWLHRTDAAGGYVLLGAHLVSPGGEVLRQDVARAALPNDVRPGEAVGVEIDLPFPPTPGEYVLRLDLVDEALTWFNTVGSKPANVPVRVDGRIDSRWPSKLGASIERVEAPAPSRRSGAAEPVRLRLRNTGDTVWLAAVPEGAGTVRVGVQLVDGAGALLDRDYFRAALPADVPPGETLELSLEVPPTDRREAAALRFDLVAEGVCWFSERGSSVLDSVL